MTVPSDLPGLAAWYCAEDTTGAAGAQVDTLRDRGPKGFALTQGTAGLRPLVLIGVGGRKALSFDGVDDRMVSSAPDVPNGSRTLFAAIRSPVATADSGYTFVSSTVTNGMIFRQLVYTNGNTVHNWVQVAGADGGSATAGQVNDGTSLFIVSASLVSGTGAAEYFTNGGSKGSSAAAVTYPGAGTTVVGQDTGSGVLFLKGDLYDLCWFDRVLTTTERADIHSYYQLTYGTAVADYRFEDRARVASARGAMSRVGGFV